MEALLIGAVTNTSISLFFNAFDAVFKESNDTSPELAVDFPNAKVIGHNEISEKECPSFDVQKWKEDNL